VTGYAIDARGLTRRFGDFTGQYRQVLALLYRVFGENLMVAKIANAAIATALAFAVHALVRRLTDDERAARGALLVTMFAPPLLIVGAVNLKEAATALVLTLAVWAALDRKPRRELASVVLALALLLVLRGVRGAPWALIALLPVAAAFAAPRRLSWTTIRRQPLGRYLGAGRFHGRGKGSSAEFDVPIAWVYVAEGDLLVRFEAYFEREKALESLGLDRWPG